jgi:(p)ppGpp synthase/HD superfamily hydrolase
MGLDLIKIREYAQKCHNDANCTYDEQNYFVHVDMVVDEVDANFGIFKNIEDYEITKAAANLHDCIEDAKQSFNDIKKISNKEVAHVVLAVTDYPDENRLLRHLLTMHKTVRDYRAIILKLCDIYANGSYSKKRGSSMYKKYKREYEYRKPIFKIAFEWYDEKINQKELDIFWDKLDKLFE